MILKCFGDYKNPTRKPPHCGNIDKRLCKNNTVGSSVSPVQPNTIPSQDRPSKSSSSASMRMLAPHTGSTTLWGSSGSYLQTRTLRPSWAKPHGAGPWRSLGLRYWPLVTSVPTSSWGKQRIRTMPPPHCSAFLSVRPHAGLPFWSLLVMGTTFSVPSNSGLRLAADNKHWAWAHTLALLPLPKLYMAAAVLLPPL